MRLAAIRGLRLRTAPAIRFRVCAGGMPDSVRFGYDRPRRAPRRRRLELERTVTEKPGKPSFAARRAQARFEPLVRPHLDYLYKLAYRFTGTADRAEDLIQDLLVRVYPRCDELARVEQLRPWLARVLYRIFIDQLRRERRAPLAVGTIEADAADADDATEHAEAVPGPEEEIDQQYDRERLRRAWEQLNPEHRAVLTLFEIEGYTLTELEQMLDVARGTVKSRLHRARTRLAQILAGMEPFDRLERVGKKRSTES